MKNQKIISALVFLLLGAGIGIGAYSYLSKPVARFSVSMHQQKIEKTERLNIVLSVFQR